MDFYFAGRDHRFGKKRDNLQQPEHQTSSAEYRFMRVVDVVTHHKKSICNIIEQRREHKGVDRNVWITIGNVFIRRFESKVLFQNSDETL
jgi:hypothetical protein